MRSFNVIFILGLGLSLGACNSLDTDTDTDRSTAEPSSEEGNGYTWGSAPDDGSTDDDCGDCDDVEDEDDGTTDGTEDDVADDGDCVETTWYLDHDLDGYGDANHGQMACDQPAGYVDNNTDLNDTDDDVHDVVRICAVDSNGYGFSVAVENLTTGDMVHWFDVNSTVPSPLFVVFGDEIVDPVCAEYPEAGVGNTIQISGLGTTAYGYGDFLVYSCGGYDGDAVFYDEDTTCSVVEFTVNGYAVTETADNTYDFTFTI